MSANNACARYGLTMEDLQKAQIKCQWRSCHGNSYAVVCGSDCEALARRLKAERAAEAKAKVIAEIGEEAYQAKANAEAAAIKAAQDQARETANRAAALQSLKSKARALTVVVAAMTPSSNLPTPTVSGARAPKKLFDLSDRDIKTIKGEKVGGRWTYDVLDLAR